jgi:hypothetical protein
MSVCLRSAVASTLHRAISHLVSDHWISLDDAVIRYSSQKLGNPGHRIYETRGTAPNPTLRASSRYYHDSQSTH